VALAERHLVHADAVDLVQTSVVEGVGDDVTRTYRGPEHTRWALLKDPAHLKGRPAGRPRPSCGAPARCCTAPGRSKSPFVTCTSSTTPPPPARISTPGLPAPAAHASPPSSSCRAPSAPTAGHAPASSHRHALPMPMRRRNHHPTPHENLRRTQDSGHSACRPARRRWSELRGAVGDSQDVGLHIRSAVDDLDWLTTAHGAARIVDGSVLDEEPAPAFTASSPNVGRHDNAFRT
jgi:hypothetical protein